VAKQSDHRLDDHLASAPGELVPLRLANQILKPSFRDLHSSLKNPIWNFALWNFGLSLNPSQIRTLVRSGPLLREAVLLLRTFLGQTELVKTRGRY